MRNVLVKVDSDVIRNAEAKFCEAVFGSVLFVIKAAMNFKGNHATGT